MESQVELNHLSGRGEGGAIIKRKISRLEHQAPNRKNPSEHCKPCLLLRKAWHRVEVKSRLMA